MIDSCVAALTAMRDHIRAGAIVADVRLLEPGTDAIRIDLEHAEGHALTILLPYRKETLGTGVDYGPLQAQPGPRRLWA